MLVHSSTEYYRRCQINDLAGAIVCCRGISAVLIRSVPTVLVNRDRPTAISVTMTLEIGRCQLRRF